MAEVRAATALELIDPDPAEARVIAGAIALWSLATIGSGVAWVEEMIHPRDSRRLLSAWVNLTAKPREPELSSFGARR